LARKYSELNVGIVFVGYPRNVAYKRAGKGNTNKWSYWKLMMQRLAITAENYGIAVFRILTPTPSGVIEKGEKQ